MGVRVGIFAMALAECRGRPRASPMARKIGIMPPTLQYAISRCPEDLIKQNIAHCAVGDGKSMRLEMDASTKTAVFAANNTELATSVTALLTRLFNNSIPYAA